MSDIRKEDCTYVDIIEGEDGSKLFIWYVMDIGGNLVPICKEGNLELEKQKEDQLKREEEDRRKAWRDLEFIKK